MRNNGGSFFFVLFGLNLFRVDEIGVFACLCITVLSLFLPFSLYDAFVSQKRERKRESKKVEKKSSLCFFLFFSLWTTGRNCENTFKNSTRKHREEKTWKREIYVLDFWPNPWKRSFIHGERKIARAHHVFVQNAFLSSFFLFFFNFFYTKQTALESLFNFWRKKKIKTINVSLKWNENVCGGKEWRKKKRKKMRKKMERKTQQRVNGYCLRLRTNISFTMLQKNNTTNITKTGFSFFSAPHLKLIGREKRNKNHHSSFLLLSSFPFFLYKWL